MSSLAYFWLCLSFTLPQISSMNIIHNGNNIRLVGPESNIYCGEGRPEFYDGNIWRPFVVCGESSLPEIKYSVFANSICLSLGWTTSVAQYIGRETYLPSNSESAEWLFNFNATYVYNKYICYSSCEPTEDLCHDCSLADDRYVSCPWLANTSTASKSFMIDSLLFYIKCSSMNYSAYYESCEIYSNFTEFDEENNQTWTSCNRYSGCETEDEETNLESDSNWNTFMVEIFAPIISSIVFCLCICFALYRFRHLYCNVDEKEEPSQKREISYGFVEGRRVRSLDKVAKLEMRTILHSEENSEGNPSCV